MPYSINSPPSTPRKLNKGAPLTPEDSPTRKGQAVVTHSNVATPTSGTVFCFDLDSPSLAQLKLTKEIDSGVPAWETPSPPKVDSELVKSIEIPPAHQTIGQFRATLELWQSIFPGDFCIFVGKLKLTVCSIPNEHDDAALSQALRCMFSPYGACSAAVNRGRAIVSVSKPNIKINFNVDRRMPYGHVQFDVGSPVNHQPLTSTKKPQNFDSALNAVNQTRGPHMLGGRKLRTEFNKANRNVLVFTPHRNDPSPDVVVAHLSQYGRIDSARPTTGYDRASGLPVGLRVRFANHLGAQRMQRMVGNGDYYFHYCYRI
nr:hypothetical protein CFP56_20351 [Quercus suber]